ncbi:hypothetical protein ACFFUO_03260 [Vibrio artabrorum]|uniref:TRAP-type C4-dicarboxylate transport system, periplasmic component n=1 Tax=Vibrio artabrorum TaxID=446374 RepID=A0ABT8CLI7_9VIBR|nr:hypothetical protein [Vibrio artabrorum]MDN3702606.1 hypothetical protein [Vibrio artabrorum]
MYKLTKAVIAAVISMSAVVSTGAQASLKLSHALPTEHPVHQSLDWFAKEVRKDAKVRVKVYPNGTLGNEAEGLQMVQNGSEWYCCIY